MHRTARIAVLALAVMAALTGVAQADWKGWGFEDFATGPVDGQHGWLQSNTGLDIAVASATGGQALQASNAVAGTSYGEQAFSGSLADSAGESTAADDGYAGGNRQPHLTARFSFTSTQAVEVNGLAIQVGLDRGDGKPMVVLRVKDVAEGLAVELLQGPDDPEPVPIASGLSRGATHTVQVDVQFVEGVANDIVAVSVDGVGPIVGTTWESAYRAASSPVPAVDELVVAALDTASTPPAAGTGLLFDDFLLISDTGPLTGPAGPAGPTGPAGSTGPAGPAGTSGADGTNGTNGVDGTSGTNGTNGTTGADGTNGINGTTGAAGAPGAAGPGGANGLSAVAIGYPVNIIDGKLDLARRRVTVTLACPQPAGLCDGVLRLRTPAGAQLSERLFDMDGGRSLSVTVRLSTSALRALRKPGKVRVVVLARSELGIAARSSRLLG